MIIFIYAIFLGLISKYLLSKNKRKYAFFIISLVTVSFFFISVDVITEKGFSRAFWYHLNQDILSGSYTPYLNLFLLNITFFLIFFLIAFYLGSKKFFLKIIKKNISYKILIFFLIIFNPAVISIIGNFELDKLKKNEVYNFNELYNNVNKLSSNLR